MGPALETLAGIAIAGVVALAYWRIARGISTVGDFMGFVTALLLAAQPIKSLGMVTTSAIEGLAAAERIYELVDEKPTVVDRLDASPLVVRQGTIVFDDVGFAYATSAGSRAVENVSLTVPGGQDGGARRPIRRRQDRRHQPRGAAFRRGRGILIDGQDLRG
jgi:subfamily B ATP-binding cassette protein MsbA